MFVALWEFEVKPGSEIAFERAYGAGGDWARLFCLDPNFLETRLLRDPALARTYVTIDRWSSREAFERFREQHKEMYFAIDSLCENLTIAERHLGSYEESKLAPA